MKRTFFLFSIATILCVGVLNAQMRPVLDAHKQRLIRPRTTTDTINLSDDSIKIPISKDATQSEILFIKAPKRDLWDNFFKYVFPIFTLLLGIGINRFFDWYKDYRRITKSGERWVAELRAWEEPIQQQINSLKKLIEEDKEDEYRHPELVIITSMDGEVFKSLDKSDLLKFVKRHKKRDFSAAIKISNQTQGTISIFANLNESLKVKFKEYQDGTSKFIAIVNENLQLLIAAIEKYSVALEPEYGDAMQYPPFAELYNLLAEHIYSKEGGGFDLYKLRDDFFLPFIKVLAGLRADSRTTDINIYTRACIHAVRGLEMEKHYWLESVKTISKRYVEHFDELQEMADKIENRGRQNDKENRSGT